MKNNLKVIVLYIVIILVLLSIASILFGNTPADQKTYSDIVALFKEDQVEQFEIRQRITDLGYKRSSDHSLCPQRCVSVCERLSALLFRERRQI